ncbi:unnamed protein product, partial [Rotaria socialis]
ENGNGDNNLFACKTKIFLFRLYREALKQAAIDPKTGRVDVAILTTGISAGERRLRADLAQTLKRYMKERKSTL